MLTPSHPAPALRLAILRTSSLGDVVLATSCLSMLVALPIPIEIFWIGRSNTLDMISRSWPQVKTIELPKNGTLSTLYDVIDKLKNIHFIVDLQCNLRSRWLCRNLKILKGIEYFESEKLQIFRSRLILEARIRGRRRPLKPKALRPHFHQYKLMGNTLLNALKNHLSTDHLNLLKNGNFPPHLPIPHNFDPPWRKELRFGYWLAIAPGAAYPTKQSPISLMTKIIKKTIELMDPSSLTNSTSLGENTSPLTPLPSLGLVFLGDNKDRDIARVILDNIDWSGPLLNLAGKLSLWESAVALHEASVLLANDSSLSHIAEAVDTPVAMLFGPTIESFGFAPRKNQSRAFSSLIGCRPCSKHGMVPCRYNDKLCFHAIDSGKVAHFLAEQILGDTIKPKHYDIEKSREKTSGQLIIE
jgi:ADP-heptose:LPS heptosyltransferase